MDVADLLLHTYPWWEMLRARALSLGSATADRRLCNEWRHAPGLHDHRYRGVTTPNCDTLYSGAWLDLSAGPILIEVPETDLPYWSIAALDLNTDNIAILGSRYPNSRSLLICAKSYHGKLPLGVPVVSSASNVVWLLGRYLIGTDVLVQQAEALRRGVALHRLQSDGGVKADSACSPRASLVSGVRHDPINFWQVIRAALDEDAGLCNLIPSARTADLHAIWPHGVAQWSGLDKALQQRVVEQFAQVVGRITANNSGNRELRAHWSFPSADIGNFGDNAWYRAEVAVWGLGALPISEVVYVSAETDSSGKPLHGSDEYCFRIPPEGIPAQAFWSLTMYELDEFGAMYFTANALKRYAIGDRTTGCPRRQAILAY
jgi:hypothetical protein